MEREEISLSISTLSPFPHSLPISSQATCQPAAGCDSLDNIDCGEKHTFSCAQKHTFSCAQV